MRTGLRQVAIVVAPLLMPMAAGGEVKVVVDNNVRPNSPAAFLFKDVPGPVKNDSASGAKFTLVDGVPDKLGGRLDVLHNGKMPTKQDQPKRNFYFGQGEDGGRIAIDLGKAIEIKQVNSYSWHPTTRGPQVYKLYAADGSAAGFNREPKRGTDPAQCGWTLVTSVDTRPAGGAGGGQYGVSIADPAGAIGKYRYLLLDISTTEKDDAFGNTFYSEIDVIDAAGPKPQSVPVPILTAVSASPAGSPHQIVIDYIDAPDLRPWVEGKLRPAVGKWYPILAQALPSENFTPPAQVLIEITEDYDGVAATTGNYVQCNVQWFKQNLDGEAVGAVVHELVHVVQSYDLRGRALPIWLVEGIADYFRWFKYEPTPTGTRPANPATANYTDSYRTTAGFLNFVAEKHDKQIVSKLNAALRQHKYHAGLWKEYTGKTADELWKEYVASLGNEKK